MVHKKINEIYSTQVDTLSGIGEETKKALFDMGIETIKDLLFCFPFRYDNFEQKDLEEAKHDEVITIKGNVYTQPQLIYYGKKKSRLTFRIVIPPFSVGVTMFNQPYLKDKLSLNQEVIVTGKWDKNRQVITAKHVQTKINEDNSMLPIYSVKAPVTVKGLRRFISLALKNVEGMGFETLPKEMLEKFKLPPLIQALKTIHFPQNENELKHARRRFVFEEFLEFQLKIQLLKKQMRDNAKGIHHSFSDDQLLQFTNSLPFKLTSAQNKVVSEILHDLRNPYSMNRLLQGDVGSGKTVVASIALYANFLSGFQGALMVPTEILAEQHNQSLQKLFENTGVVVELLTSSVKGKRRKEILEKLEKNEVHILVGTHALIQPDVTFSKLGLVITDEQHRFGVGQRRVLREKGSTPDVLFMTATPIPRTLAITAFGEMDVSIIDQMPEGRKSIQTYWVQHDMLERVLAFILKEHKKGFQSYVICPLIEESEKLDLQNAMDVYETLRQAFGTQCSVGLMHGKLANAEKDEVMKRFAANEINVLVSTTVVEVGVNVPNATLMVIYDAERFGLSQLHQLRGRVGRGETQSYCILIANPKSEIGKERMQIMTETTDGFVLSERDLELRGPGDFFGVKQSGVPQFKIADMVHDYRALEVSRQVAEQIVKNPAVLQNEGYEHISYLLQRAEKQLAEKLD